MTLTRADLDVLAEAMEVWENKDFMDELMFGITDMVLCKDEFDRQEAKARRSGKVKELEATRKVRRERSVLLRAKLIMMKDKLDAAAL